MFWFPAGSLTLFAPTDDAFKALPPGALDALSTDPDKLKGVLLNHVLKGTVCRRELPSVHDVATIGGGSIPVVVTFGLQIINWPCLRLKNQYCLHSYRWHNCRQGASCRNRSVRFQRCRSRNRRRPLALRSSGIPANKDGLRYSEGIG